MAKKIVTGIGFGLSALGFAFLIYSIIVVLTNSYSLWKSAGTLNGIAVWLGIPGFIMSIVGLCMRGNKAQGIFGIIFGVIDWFSVAIILIVSGQHISSMF